MLLYQKLMLLHNILHSKPSRIIRRMMLEQDTNPFPNCWLEELKNTAEKMNFTVNLHDIQQTTKVTFKGRVKELIEKNLEKNIKINAGSKMRTVLQDKFEKKKYISDGFLSEKEIGEIMKIRLHMGNMKDNYRESSPGNCQFCKEEIETTEHILFECKSLDYLRIDLKISGIFLYSMDADKIKSILEMNRRVNLIKI